MNAAGLRWGRRLLGLAVATLVACGDNIAVGYGVSGGTRLEPRFWDAGDGARVFRTWFDRELGVDCIFDLATDGRFRCLPTGASASLAFADAACTRPLTIAPTCAPAPVFAFGPRRATPGCLRSMSRAIHDVGRVAGTSVFRKNGPGGACAPGAVASGDRAYELGAERDPTEFVGATLEAQGDARLVPYVFVGDDGSTLFDGTWDTQRNNECAAQDADVCRPVEIALYYDFLFSDAGCTKNDAVVDLSDYRPCHLPRAVLGDGEPYGSDLREIGAQISVGDVYRHDAAAGTCTPVIPYDDETFWFEGAPIASESFAAMSRVLDGSGRVRAERWLDADGGSLAAARGFFDTELDELCSPRSFADGTRCAAGSAAQSHYSFRDAGCKHPVIPWSGEKPPFVYVLHDGPDQCDAVEFEGAYELGDVVAQATYFGKQGTSCTSMPVPMDFTLYELGPEIDVPSL